MRRAFTLIELLVVVAIIAILAALLFPVFSQAKAAAKQVVSLSNVKQLSLGIQMYMSDNADRYPVGIGRRWDEDEQVWRGFKPWFQRAGHYIRSNDIREASGHPKPLIRRKGRVVRWGTHYGLNPSLGWGNRAIFASRLENPAGLVMLSLGAVYREDLLSSPDNLDPKLWRRHAYWFPGWGTWGPMGFRGRRHFNMYDPARKFPARQRPVMVYQQNTTVSFCDGHAKAMPINALIGPMPMGWDLGDARNLWDNR